MRDPYMVLSRHSPKSGLQVAKEQGISRSHANLLVRTFYRQGYCYIAKWIRDSRGCASIPAYQLGNKKDAQKPEPKTPYQVCKKYNRKREVKDRRNKYYQTRRTYARYQSKGLSLVDLIKGMNK